MLCPDLPLEIWKQILVQVPVRDRIASSAVSEKLHKAAAAVTTDLEVDCGGSLEKHASFLGWINHIICPLTRLKFQSSPGTLRQLPCPHLLELTLEGPNVQLGSSSIDTLGILHSCTAQTTKQKQNW